MSSVELVDALSFSRGFPVAPSPEIHREHLLDTLGDILSSGKTDVLLVDGDEGVGKTVLLSQFVRRHRQSAISLFLRPASRSAIDPTYITSVLSEQLHWMLHGEPLRNDVVSDADLRQYFGLLDRRLHRANKKCYVVVDGLEDSASQTLSVSVLTELLPLGMSSYRYLLSGSVEGLGRHLHRSLSVKPYYPALCSLDDARRFLDGLTLSTENVEEFYKLCRKNFGKLSNVRRLLVGGMTPESLLTDAFPDFLEIEWQSLSNTSGLAQRLLAIVAFAQCSYTVLELARILNVTPDEIRSELDPISCLVTDSETKEVSFYSEAHRRFIQRRMAADRKAALESLIGHHSSVEGTGSFTPLPQYLYDSGKYRELLGHLNTEYFLGLAEHTQSLTALERATRLGLESAMSVADVSEHVRFTAQASFLNEIAAGETSKEEIRARVRIGDKGIALALAERASLREDRLSLLVTSAAALKEFHGERDEAVIAHITALCEQVDFAAMGDRTLNLASELVAVEPDLAFKILQRSSKGSEGTASIDETFAKFALHAIASRRGRLAEIATSERVRKNIQDPELQQFFGSISLFLQTTSAAEVIRHAESLAPSEALLFLRRWSEITSAYDEAAAVLDYALELLIKTTSYVPKLRDLRELSTPLRRLSDQDAMRRLIARFDGQRSTVLDLGTNEEHTRLTLQLAAAEAALDQARANQRMLELYWEVSEIRDASAKAACLSWMLVHYRDVDRDGSLDARESLLAVLQDDLDASIRDLLRTTADHFAVAKGALRAFAKSDTAYALRIASSLNAEARRDQAYFEIVRCASSPALTSTKLGDFFVAIERIADFEYKAEAISLLARAFCKSKLSFPSDTIGRIYACCKTIEPSLLRAASLADLYNRVRRDGPDNLVDFQKKLRDDIEQAWSSIDAVWRKASLAFRIASDLGKHDVETARLYIERGETVRKSGSIIATSQFNSFECLVRLTIRAAVGLIASRAEMDPRSILSRIVNVVPSAGERACLWADFACRAGLLGRQDCCESVVTEHIRPLLEQIAPENGGARWRAETRVAPALYLSHPRTALERIRKLPSSVADDAASNILNLVLNQCPPDDPHAERRTSRHKLKYEQLTDLFAVIEVLCTDATIYYFTAEICKRASIRGELTRQQMNDIANRIEQEVIPRFPDKKNIAHSGYAVASQALVGKLRQYTEEQWKSLLARASSIPNTADEAFVLVVVAEQMSAKHPELAKTALGRAKTLMETLPANVDRIDRFLTCAEAALDIDQSLAKECVRAAYSHACVDPSDDLASRRRRILDSASQISTTFAESLIKVIDDDPARALLKSDAENHLRVLALEKTLTANEREHSETTDLDEDLGAGAWRALGLLNAGWVAPAHLDELLPYIRACATLPLGDSAYPVLSWVIESQLRRTIGSPAARTLFSRLFHALAHASDAAIAIIDKTSGADQVLAPSFGVDSLDAASPNLVVRPGEREKAVAFLLEWLGGARDYLKICDPYFSADDLDLLREIRAVNREIRIIVMTSRANQKTTVDLSEHYPDRWLNRVSPVFPGNCDIVVVGTTNKGEFPIHDRWWISSGKGLRLGTSYNSLGVSKVSEISSVTADEVRAQEAEIDAILQRTKREHKGQLLSLNVIAL